MRLHSISYLIWDDALVIVSFYRTKSNNTILKTALKLFVVITIIIAFSCQKDEYTTSSDAKLKFSVDTITFDTIFTTVGSTTKRLMVYNPHKEWIRISSIYLANGEASFFKLNIDGKSSRNTSNIELAPKDSLYIFIEVTIDPNNSNTPLVVTDSIIFITNGNHQDVDLRAWGQDVHIYRGDILSTQTWVADKPYLIIDSVIIDSNNTLTIEAGATIHFHKRSVMLVRGDLQVNGNRDNPIVFRGDRLDDAVSGIPYDYLPEQWGGIVFFHTSTNNNIQYAVIKNGIYGFLMEIGSEVNIENTIIDNHSYAGIYAVNATLSVKNCVITNCGYYNVLIIAGGNYEFYHSTIANYYIHGPRKDPAIAITNYIIVDEEIFYGDLEKAFFGNCIIYGNNKNELGFSSIDEGEFNYTFDHCLIKLTDTTDMNLDEDAFRDITYNEDPKFKQIDPYNYSYNFELDTLSPAKDKGSFAFIATQPVLQSDILGNPRPADRYPDLGAYERIE